MEATSDDVKAKLTNWSTKTEEANQKYRQMQNKADVSFAEGQAWLYNHCAASFESSDKATIQAYEPATFVAVQQKADNTLALDDLRASFLAPHGTRCYCELMQAYRNVGTRMQSSSRLSGIALSTSSASL